MKTTTKLLGILVVFGLLTLVAGSVSAQSLKAQFDEWGVGSSNNTALLYTYPALDPVSGLSTLMYRLPFPAVTPGDLIITESTGAVSDLIRFGNDSISGIVYFYSDPADESPAPPADNPFGIPSYSAAFPPVSEIGTEGNDYANYFAAAGMPGSALQNGNALGVAYTIISDSAAVPEPSTVVLLGMSAISLLFCARRRRK